MTKLTPEDKQRIEGGKWFDEAVKEAMDQGGEFLEGFNRHLITAYRSAEKKKPPARDTMSESEAIKFEVSRCLCKKHLGQEWGDVPREYTAFIADISQELIRYVRSDRFKEREE